MTLPDRRTLLGVVAATGLACSVLQPGPDAVVLGAFDAYMKAESAKVADLMSDAGKGNADLYCSGSALNCLKNNYGQRGTLLSRSAEVKSQGDTSAEVVLKTTWQPPEGGAQAATVCQVYQLDHSDKGWRIRFFEPPRACS